MADRIDPSTHDVLQALQHRDVTLCQGQGHAQHVHVAQDSVETLHYLEALKLEHSRNLDVIQDLYYR